MNKKTLKIIEYIKNNDICIEYTTSNNCVLVREKFGSYLIEFDVIYNQVVKNYISSSYNEPEECDIIFEPQDIENVNIYINNEFQDFSDNEIEAIKNNLYWKIVHES